MTALESVIRESWPTGLVDHTPKPHVDLALVLRTDADTRRETRMLDALEAANRRALQRWHAAGKEMP